MDHELAETPEGPLFFLPFMSKCEDVCKLLSYPVSGTSLYQLTLDGSGFGIASASQAEGTLNLYRFSA